MLNVCFPCHDDKKMFAIMKKKNSSSKTYSGNKIIVVRNEQGPKSSKPHFYFYKQVSPKDYAEDVSLVIAHLINISSCYEVWNQKNVSHTKSFKSFTQLVNNDPSLVLENFRKYF